MSIQSSWVTSLPMNLTSLTSLSTLRVLLSQQLLSKAQN